MYASIGKAGEALNYCRDMASYAGDEVKSDVENLASELKFRIESRAELGEKFLDKARVIAHQVKIGWR